MECAALADGQLGLQIGERSGLAGWKCVETRREFVGN